MIRNNLFKLLIGVLLAGLVFFVSKNYTRKRETYRTAIKATGNDTFGYQIFKDKQLVIEQLTVPGSTGNYGFVNEEQTQKVADLVVRKLSAGIFPPTVTQSELDSLHINY